jgi:hypothetical protein
MSKGKGVSEEHRRRLSRALKASWERDRDKRMAFYRRRRSERRAAELSTGHELEACKPNMAGASGERPGARRILKTAPKP